MAEIMVNLRVLRDIEPVLKEQAEKGIEIRRARSSEGETIADWVREYINPNWGVACEVAVEQTPPDCFVAYRKSQNGESNALTADNLLGFACYDVVTKGVFGPSAVREDESDKGISTALMLAGLHAMSKEYSQAVIGWATSATH